MPYGDILKRAWLLTRRHKILWLFGLLAGAGGGINFGDLGDVGRRGNALPDGSRFPGMPEGMGEGMPWQGGGFGPMALEWLQRNAGTIALVVALAALLGLVLLVVGIAAKGGLVHLSARADAEAPVLAADGWRIGFHHWWRTLGTHRVIFVPIVAVVLVGATVLGVTGLGALAAFGADRPGLGGSGVVAIIGLALLFLPILFLATLIATLILELALRHAILADRPVFDAVGAAWRDLRGRFVDVFVMWLVMLLGGFAFAFVFAFIAALALTPAIIAGIASDSVATGIAFGIPGILILLVPVGAYSAWRSTAWTLFWQRLTGITAPVHTGTEPPVLIGS